MPDSLTTTLLFSSARTIAALHSALQPTTPVHFDVVLNGLRLLVADNGHLYSCCLLDLRKQDPVGATWSDPTIAVAAIAAKTDRLVVCNAEDTKTARNASETRDGVRWLFAAELVPGVIYISMNAAATETATTTETFTFDMFETATATKTETEYDFDLFGTAPVSAFSSLHHSALVTPSGRRTRSRVALASHGLLK